MSGDVQPRKRKDKKRKKDSSSDRAKAEAEFIARKLSLGDESDEGISIPGKGSSSHSPSLGEGDSIIHVHHDEGTGGHWCAKIVFFSLLAVLVFLIGLILVENRGLTDLDVPATESRYAQLFDGWVDEGPFHDDHHDEHTLELKHEDEHSHEDEIEDHNDEDIEPLEDEHGHTDYELSDGEDEDGTDDDEDQSQEYLEHDDDDDDDKADEDDDNDDDDDNTAEDDDDGDDIHEIDYNGDKAEDLDDDNDDDYLGASNENDDDDDDNDSQGIEEDDDAEKPLEEVDSNEEDVVDNSAGEEELLAAKKAEQLAQEQEDSGVGMRVGIGLALVIVAYGVLARKLGNASCNDDESDVTGDLNRRMTLIDNVDDEDEDIEEIEQPPPIKKIVSPPVKSAPPPSQPSPAQQPTVKTPPMSAETSRIRQVIHRYIEDDDEEEPIKEIIQKPVEEKKIAPVAEAPKPKELVVKQESEEDVEEITKEEIQNLEYEDEEDLEDEEIIEEEEVDEENIEEEEEEDEEIEDDISDDADDTELLKKLEAKYGKLPQQDDDQAEGNSDDEPPPSTPARKKGKTGGGNSVEDGEHEEEWEDDTNSDEHWKEQLELAEAEMEEGNLDKAYRQFTALTLTNKTSPLAKLGRARALEALAEAKRSNVLLDKTIDAYRDILEMRNVKKKLFVQVADKTIMKMRFRGKYIDAVPVHYMLITKFPTNVTYRNDLAITYLMVNKINMARKVLSDTLSKWPDNGVALVHYGFILKTEDNNLADGVKYMQKGIDVGGKETLDGRFLFHLGDGYSRLGEQDKARKIYELGASIGVFLSPLQRSLYNVNRLTGRPWWKAEETPYGKLFEDLESNWKEIAMEARKLHSSYEQEHENLMDKGDWGQFQLFARGREVNNNCVKSPVTCGIIKRENSAWNCRRGQVKFSAMQPGTHVFAHTGPTNCRLRAHLGLTGTRDTYIRVANEIRSWEEGKIFIFDDSFEHEVWHNGTELRIVLIVDLWHPELTKDERQTLPAI